MSGTIHSVPRLRVRQPDLNPQSVEITLISDDPEGEASAEIVLPVQRLDLSFAPGTGDLTVADLTLMPGAVEIDAVSLLNLVAIAQELQALENWEPASSEVVRRVLDASTDAPEGGGD